MSKVFLTFWFSILSIFWSFDVDKKFFRHWILTLHNSALSPPFSHFSRKRKRGKHFFLRNALNDRINTYFYFYFYYFHYYYRKWITGHEQRYLKYFLIFFLPSRLHYLLTKSKPFRLSQSSKPTNRNLQTFFLSSTLQTFYLSSTFRTRAASEASWWPRSKRRPSRWCPRPCWASGPRSAPATPQPCRGRSSGAGPVWTDSPDSSDFRASRRLTSSARGLCRVMKTCGRRCTGSSSRSGRLCVRRPCPPPSCSCWRCSGGRLDSSLEIGSGEGPCRKKLNKIEVEKWHLKKCDKSEDEGKFYTFLTLFLKPHPPFKTFDQGQVGTYGTNRR